MPKETAVEIGCGVFDQPDFQSLNDFKIFFVVLQLQF